ncbi:hypothetical protein JQ596_22900 [Bradyrhizobium manausense]|uniref:hypothetical protein n=1 Tax=Bradyrhizobium TaxID=374 RepID=UPI001BA4B785|nr:MULTISPECIES: hypothetical protein [Bradyrhizobium]MBR0828390.1 hypothetical protein [Bradyrhizobium manausense]UVO25544.1 hypothetical protein KUF59_23400 [Bradyrhizobium arachidis]
MVAALIMARGYKAGGFPGQAQIAATQQQRAISKMRAKLEVVAEFPFAKGVPEYD